MKNHCIAYLFLLCHAIGLEADDKAIGASLFLGSIAAHRIMSNNQREPVDQATVMIENIKKTDHQQNLAETRQKLKDEGIGKISHQRKNDLSELLQRRFQASAKISPCPSPATVATLSPSLSNNSLSNSAMLLAIENSSSASANSHVHKSLRRTQFVRLNEFETFAAPESSPLIHEQAIVEIQHERTPKITVQTFFPNFSNPIFQTLHNNPGYKDPTNPRISFLDATTDVTERQYSNDLHGNKIFKYQSISPKSEHQYWQEHGISNERISLYSIHGSHNSNIHGSRQEMMPDLIRLGKKIALAQQKPVDIYYFEWNGAVDQEVRMKAGNDLARIIEQDTNHEIIAVAHSHGGTVVGHAAKALEGTKTIDRAILFGCPNFGQEINIHDNKIGQIFNIYSEGDFTGRAGSFIQTANLWSLLSPSSQVTETSLRKKANNIINISLQLQGNFPNHRETIFEGIDHTDQLIENNMGRNTLTNIHNMNQEHLPRNYRIQSCLNPTLHHQSATQDQITHSQSTIKEFKDIYGVDIDRKATLSENFKHEIASAIPPALQCMGVSALGRLAVNRAESLENDPVNNTISAMVAEINNERDLLKKTILLNQFHTKLQKKHSETNQETIQLSLDEHIGYNVLKQELDTILTMLNNSSASSRK